jgi:hypothetical protein
MLVADLPVRHAGPRKPARREISCRHRLSDASARIGKCGNLRNIIAYRAFDFQAQSTGGLGRGAASFFFALAAEFTMPAT